MTLDRLKLSLVVAKLRPNVKELVEKGVLSRQSLQSLEDVIETLRLEGIYVADEPTLAEC